MMVCSIDFEMLCTAEQAPPKNFQLHHSNARALIGQRLKGWLGGASG
jgi:hypothetical protein